MAASSIVQRLRVTSVAATPGTTPPPGTGGAATPGGISVTAERVDQDPNAPAGPPGTNNITFPVNDPAAAGFFIVHQEYDLTFTKAAASAS